jgi:recyclin-1
MSRFVLNLYHGKIQEYVQNKLLNEKLDPEKYLNQLQDLYSKTCKLTESLASSKIMGANITFLNTCTRAIFSKFLDPPPPTSLREDDSYFKIEKKNLEDKCSMILKRFYESKNHQKKTIQAGSIHDLKRDLQAKIGRANINIANINITVSGLENYGSETFLSEEVAINILQETKLALIRCALLSKPSDLPKNATEVFQMQIKHLITEHIDYALDLALHSIPTSEPKSQPEIHFFEVVRQANAVSHLFEKQFVDSVIPVVVSSPKHAECLKNKKEAFEQMEIKLNTGLERVLNSIIAWTKILLSKEQKKNEFQPETDDIDMVNTTVSFDFCLLESFKPFKYFSTGL